jgi:hypothetical protein
MSEKKRSMTAKALSKKQETTPGLALNKNGVPSHTATARRISDQTRKAAKSGYPPKVDPEGDGILCVNFDAKSPDEGLDNLIAAMQAFGTSDLDMLFALAKQMVGFCPPHVEERVGWQNGALAMLHGIAPTNELEAMLAVQMVACHTMAMETTRRAMIKDQTFEGVHENISRANRLMKTFVALAEALAKLRGESKTVTIKHVNVNAGGKAVIGDVHHGRSDGKK